MSQSGVFYLSWPFLPYAVTERKITPSQRGQVGLFWCSVTAVARSYWSRTDRKPPKQPLLSKSLRSGLERQICFVTIELPEWKDRPASPPQAVHTGGTHLRGSLQQPG